MVILAGRARVGVRAANQAREALAQVLRVARVPLKVVLVRARTEVEGQVVPMGVRRARAPGQTAGLARAHRGARLQALHRVQRANHGRKQGCAQKAGPVDRAPREIRQSKVLGGLVHLVLNPVRVAWVGPAVAVVSQTRATATLAAALSPDRRHAATIGSPKAPQRTSHGCHFPSLQGVTVSRGAQMW